MEIFKLFGTIMVDNDKANKSISDTDGKAKGFTSTLGKGITTVAKWGAAIGAAAVAGGTALYGMATKAAETTDRIDKLSAKIGLSKQGFQEWDYIMGQNGMDVDKLQVGIKTLVTQMDSAASGSKTATEAFSKLNLSWTDGTGKLKNQEQMMNEAIIALANMENGSEKARLATQLFGKAGTEMMPMLNNGAQGIEDLRKRAHDLGLVMSDEAVTAGVVLGDTIDDVKQSFGAIVTKIGVGVMPIIQKFLDFILSKMPIIQTVLGGVFKGIELFVSSVTRVISNLFGGMNIDYTTFFNGLKTIWETYGKPIFDSLKTTIQTVYDNSVPIIEGIKNLFSILMDYVKVAWESIGKPVWDTMVLAIQRVLEVFNYVFPIVSEIFGGVCETLSKLWEEVLKPVIQAIGDFLEGTLLPIWETVFNFVASSVEGAFSVIGTLWNDTLKPILDGIIDFISGAFSGNWEKAWKGIVSIFEGIWNGIVNVVKGIVNGTIIKGINFIINGINSVGFDIPDFLGGGHVGFDIDPMPEWYADGAILTKPTVFGYNPYSGKQMVGGEAGPEAIAPIDKLLGFVKEAVKSEVKEFDYNRIAEAMVYAIKATGMNNPTIYMSKEKVGQVLGDINDEIGGYNAAIAGRRMGL